MYFKDQFMDINRNNYETFFLLYLDRELDPSEMLEVENFVNANADLKKEFSLLSQTILIPAEAEFSQKELLFRKEDDRRVIPIYWTRIAAAVAVLAFGGWLMTLQWTGKHKDGLTGSDGKQHMIAAKKNDSGQKVKVANNNAEELPLAATNDTQDVAQQTAIAKNPTAQNSGKTKVNIKQESDLPRKNRQVQPLVAVNPDQQTAPAFEHPDGANLTMQKSSAQALQPVESQNGRGPGQISAMPSGQVTGLLIAAGAVENVKYENAMSAENDDQTDNAISVVALNDKNKGITKLFKKLTSRAPTDEKERKVRVSVFQFSY
jgi:hypothetical protein